MDEYELTTPLFCLQALEAVALDREGEHVALYVRLGPTPDHTIGGPLVMPVETARALLIELARVLADTGSAAPTVQ